MLRSLNIRVIEQGGQFLREQMLRRQLGERVPQLVGCDASSAQDATKPACGVWRSPAADEHVGRITPDLLLVFQNADGWRREVDDPRRAGRACRLMLAQDAAVITEVDLRPLKQSRFARTAARVRDELSQMAGWGIKRIEDAYKCIRFNVSFDLQRLRDLRLRWRDLQPSMFVRPKHDASGDVAMVLKRLGLVCVLLIVPSVAVGSQPLGVPSNEVNINIRQLHCGRELNERLDAPSVVLARVKMQPLGDQGRDPNRLANQLRLAGFVFGHQLMEPKFSGLPVSLVPYVVILAVDTGAESPVRQFLNFVGTCHESIRCTFAIKGAGLRSSPRFRCVG